MQALLDLYGEGLARIVGAASPDARRRSPSDELVAHLLLLHGLHPVPLEERVRGALDEVRPYLESHGGDVELLGVDGRRRAAAAAGRCNGCPSSAVTLKLAIEDAIQQAAPDVERDRGRGRRRRRPPALLQIELACPVRAAEAAERGTRGLAARRSRTRRARGRAQEHCELCGEPIPADAPPPARPRRTRELHVRVPAVRAAVRPRRGAAAATTGSSPTAGCGSTTSSSTTRAWEELRIPVDMAFFFHSTRGRSAWSPSTRARWARPSRCSSSTRGTALEAANPVLDELEPDVEALLVNRARGAREHWLVPIDDCYALVGLIRTHWRGLPAAARCGRRSARFFDGLDRRAQPASRDHEEMTWRT